MFLLSGYCIWSKPANGGVIWKKIYTFATAIVCRVEDNDIERDTCYEFNSILYFAGAAVPAQQTAVLHNLHLVGYPVLYSLLSGALSSWDSARQSGEIIPGEERGGDRED